MADAAELAAEIGPRAYLNMAETARRDGLSSVAVEYARGAARAAIDQPAVHGEAMLVLGDLLIAEQAFDEAERCFGEAAQLFDLEQDSGAVGLALAALGQLFLERGRHLEAVGTLRAALERLPGAVEVRLDFARALMAAGEVPAALGEYTTVLVSAPYEAKLARVTAVVERGLANIRSGDHVSGLRDLTDAVDLDPSLAESAVVLAARREAERRVAERGLAAAT
jgi:tetratricopeptide (TPR) repeat protein